MSEQQQPFGNFRLPDTSSFDPRPIVAPISDYTGGRIATALELIAGAIGQVTAAKLLEPKPPASVQPGQSRFLTPEAVQAGVLAYGLSTDDARKSALEIFGAIWGHMLAADTTLPVWYDPATQKRVGAGPGEEKPPATEAAEIVIPKRILDRAATMLSAWRSDLSQTHSPREAAWTAFLTIETGLAADNPTMPRFRLAEDIRR